MQFGMQDGAADFSYGYTLDDNGNVTAMSDKTGSTTYTYDENDSPTSEHRVPKGLAADPSKKVAYAYYPNGMPRTMDTYGGVVGYSWDAAMRLSSRTEPLDGGRAITYGYDGRGRLLSTHFPNGTRQAHEYSLGRVSRVSLWDAAGTARLQDYQYDYASGGQFNSYVKKVTELDGSAVSYSYDDLDRLVGATRTGSFPYTQGYAYDDNDNRTSITKNGATTSAAYDAANQLVRHGTTNYTYDRAGNMTGSGDDAFSYDPAGHMTGGALRAGTTTTQLAYGYDGWGRRVSRGTPGGAAAAAGDLQPAAGGGGDGGDPPGGGTRYWYDATGMSMEDNGVEPSHYGRGPGGLETIRTMYTGTAGVASYYGHDRLGSVTALVANGAGGGLRGAYGYDPYGMPGPSGGVSPDVYNPYRYAGTYQDAASTKLYQMGARYYDAAAGRFTQRDPLDGWSYHYGNSNPVNYVDPDGLAPCSPLLSASTCGGGGAGGGGVTTAATAAGATAATGVAAYGYSQYYSSNGSQESTWTPPVYDGLQEDPEWYNLDPTDDEPIRTDPVGDPNVDAALQTVEPGTWEKKYWNGYHAGTTDPASYHYFEHEGTGRVTGGKVRPGWIPPNE